MANTFQFSSNSTFDDELDRYAEAAETEQSSIGLNPNVVKKRAYNQETNTTDLFASISGGFVKIGEEPLSALADLERYDQSLRSMGVTPTANDFYAAGFDDAVISESGILDAALPLTEPVAPEKTGRVVPLTSAEQEQIIAQGGDIAAQRSQTMRETLVQGQEFDPAARGELISGISYDPMSGAAFDPLTGELIPGGLAAGIESTVNIIAEVVGATGIDPKFARQIAEGIMGNANATRDFGLGLADFTPAGLFLGAQEGYKTFQRGKASGDGITMGAGILEAGLSLLEALPITVVAAKALKETAIPALREALISLGRGADARIAERGNALFSNPVGPTADEILALIGRMIKPSEKAVLETKLPPEIVQQTEAQIAQQKNQFPAEEGWVQNDLEVTGVKQDKKGNVVVSYKEVPYNFHLAPEGQTDAQWKATMVTRAVEQVNEIAARAIAGDAPAQEIIRQANWYRAMRSRMRQEFGGLGDVFADLLGTTSAQTGVTQNWDNAVEIMRRFTRGEFDQEIKMYEDMVAAGDANPVTLGQYHNDPDNPFKLITKAGGQLFNANSPSSTRALLDLFRTAQGAPKTPNFTGNIIGYTNAATIDVWAARFLRRVAGLDRIPPPAEKGVAGSHLAGSTLEDPKVGSEFGFGQAVLKDAADQINASGVVTSVDPSIGQMGPDDLQAVLWFIEKEIWTAKGWTSKAGEGGSLDFEASFAGAADPMAVKDLRKTASASFKDLPPLKQKAGESNIDYAARTAEREQKARTKFDAKTAAAAEQLDPMKASLARYVLGVSTERPGMRPTNLQQSEVSARLGEPAKADESVVMYQVNNTYGRFMQSDERAFNAEFVVRENFNPAPIKKRMVEVGKEFDQDAVFISKVLPERTPSARPGVEIYFRNRQDADFARALSDELTTYGVDGFTFVTDSRVMDQPIRQATQNTEAVAGITGIRFQYIPEFDMGAAAWNAMSDAERAARVDEVQELFSEVAIDIKEKNPDVSTANLTFYDTEVIERDGYDAIIGTAAQ